MARINCEKKNLIECSVTTEHRKIQILGRGKIKKYYKLGVEKKDREKYRILPISNIQVQEIRN